MKRKVFVSCLALVIAYMLAYYVLKFIFPEQFYYVLTGTAIMKFGDFLATHKTFDFIFSIFTLFVTLYIFSCACGAKFYLNWWKSLIILALAVISKLSSMYLPTFYLHISIVIMFISACVANGNLYRTTLVFSVHGFLQLLLLKIRGFETILPVTNKGFIYALGLECYVWLILFYIIFNMRKENKENERRISTIH